MEIGIDDLDMIDDVEIEQQEEEIIENQEEIQEQNVDTHIETEDDFIASVLRSKGISDMSKIKFENEEGEIEEVDWNTLSNEDRLNIINSSESQNDLDDSEIELLNAIRQSGLTPSEYLQNIEKVGVDRYIQNSQTQQYSVDSYTDDELFIADFMSRMQDVTEEEAQEALDRAKQNETLYKKQIGAIRQEYKNIEDENLKQEQLIQEQEAQERFNQFSNSVIDEINNFTEYSGYDLNLEDEDMQQLYDFITGQDAAGFNHFSKALQDPKILVKTAWLALNGEQMISDITEYFQKEITKVRKESYKKGVEEAQGKMNTNVVYRQKSPKTKLDDDFLDD